MSTLKSKHAFGSEKDVDGALQNGFIDAYDILFLDEGKIGWIDRDGNKVIVGDKQQVVTTDRLPDVGQPNTVYICNNLFYFWDGEKFISSANDSAAVWEDM